MEKVLTDIQAQMATVAGLKYTDQDWGQLDYYSAHPPAVWPAAVVGLESVQWSNLGKLRQEGLATIRVRVADLRLTPSSSKASATQKAAAMEIIRTVDAVTKALHGWCDNPPLAGPVAGQITYSRLIRTATRRLPREDGLQVYEILFTTSVNEDLNVPPVAVAGVTPVLISP